MVDEHTYKPVPAKVVKITDEAPAIKTFRLKCDMKTPVRTPLMRRLTEFLSLLGIDYY